MFIALLISKRYHVQYSQRGKKMTESVNKTVSFEKDGVPVYNIRITNQTGDYIDISTLGARITGMHVHNEKAELVNITAPADPAACSIRAHACLIDGPYSEELNLKIWDIIEETNTSVLLSTETKDSLKVGLRITWVSLNRLIIDLFVTSKDSKEVVFNTSLQFSKSDFAAACFSPAVNGQPAESTQYADGAFVPMTDKTDVFSNPSEEIKPVLELKDGSSPLRISLYNTYKNASASFEGDYVKLTSFDDEAVKLNAGETLTQRVIVGIDYITTNLASDENDPESPFMGFF